jgi:hypothetical protein
VNSAEQSHVVPIVDAYDLGGPIGYLNGTVVADETIVAKDEAGRSYRIKVRFSGLTEKSVIEQIDTYVRQIRRVGSIDPTRWSI